MSAAVQRLVKEAEAQLISLQAIVSELRHHAIPSSPGSGVGEPASSVSPAWVRTDKMIKARVYKLAEREFLTPKAAFAALQECVGKPMLKYSSEDQATAVAFLESRGV